MPFLSRIHCFLCLCFLLTGLLGSQARVLAAPGNNDFANAANLSGPTSGTTVGANLKPANPSPVSSHMRASGIAGQRPQVELLHLRSQPVPI